MILYNLIHASCFSGRMVIVGGFTSKAVLSDAWIFDSALAKWRAIEINDDGKCHNILNILRYLYEKPCAA